MPPYNRSLPIDSKHYVYKANRNDRFVLTTRGDSSESNRDISLHKIMICDLSISIIPTFWKLALIKIMQMKEYPAPATKIMLIEFR